MDKPSSIANGQKYMQLQRKDVENALDLKVC